MDRLPDNVLCLFSRVLGGKTFSGQASQALAGLGIRNPRFVYLEEADYGTFHGQLPLPNRLSRMFIGSEIMRIKLRRDPPPPCDAVLVQSFELLPACAELPPGVPVVLAHDSTNVLSYRLIRDQEPSWRAGLACWLKEKAVTPYYRRVLPRVRAFLPRTHWCADSLVRDFGVDRRRIAVIPSGLDVETWTPAPQDGARRWGGVEDVPTLLFVGNDFVRKGGPFLLELFARRIHPRARLRILSNDPCLRGVRAPGVEIVSGLHPGHREDLLEQFRACDIFVFPTRKEHMGLALVEAAAAGLPLVASDVGGVGEIARDGENGRLLPRGAGQAEWAEALLELVADPEKRLRYGRRSRAIAVQECSQAALRDRLRWAMAMALN